MHKALLFIIVLLTCGCVAGRGDYIRPSDHPLTQKLYGDYDNIVHVAKEVLWHNGWKVKAVTNAAIYERSTAEGESTENDVVIFTEPRDHFRWIYFCPEHLNVFVHHTAEGAQVEVRSNTHNKRLAKNLFIQMEQALLASK